MIPIRDTIQARKYPVVNSILIALNVFLFFIEMGQGPNFNQFIITYGFVPARYTVPEIAFYFTLGQQILALFSYMFLHGGFVHLLGNMWSLYIFGDNIEDRLGHLRYLAFYLLCGWVSGLCHLLFNWHSHIPTIGASGAIAGVMGAYFILYPKSRILTLIPIIIIPYFLEIPAFIFLGIWFVLQFISAAGAQSGATGVAWWAHIGGFIFGIIFLKLFLRLPSIGISEKLFFRTPERKTPRIQVIRPEGVRGTPDLYGAVYITPMEARFGTRKLINIPRGIQKRLLRVTVPTDVKTGTLLRLTGMGKTGAEGIRGDLYLKVIIHDWKSSRK